MNFKILLLLSCLFSFSSATGRVVFRLDDIQDYWIVNAQQAVIDVFKTAQLPMTVGVIANYFGEDETIVDYIKECLQTPGFDIEIANHGYNHEDFPTFTLAQQQTLLSESVTKTVGILSPLISDITTFIPPFDDFNLDTITALENTGFTAFSSDISFYGYDDSGDYNPEGARAYPGSNANFKEYPAGTGTNDLYDQYVISVEDTMAGIRAQIASVGFSVVMMHFNWYCDENGNLNQTVLSMLQQVVQECQTAGYSFGTVGGLTEYLYGGSSSSSSSSTTGKVATPLTTGKATPITTGKVASLTTGHAASMTTGKSASLTTGRVASLTTGHAAPLTTGKVPSSTTGASSTCSEGYMMCLTSETYSTCAHSAWGVSQSCAPGTTCHPSGDYIYCY